MAGGHVGRRAVADAWRRAVHPLRDQADPVTDRAHPNAQPPRPIARAAALHYNGLTPHSGGPGILAMRALALAAALTGAVASAALPLAAHANGNHAHEAISLRAVAHLPPGPLKALLQAPDLQQALMNGTFFPDGGYVIGHGYGETAHWEPYQRALLAHLGKAHPALEKDPAARPKLAFLFGMFSHGMADQVYDALFMEAGKHYDKAGWSDDLFTSFDTATDVFWVAQAGASPMPEPWLPMDDLRAVFQARGEPVPEATLTDAQQTLAKVILGWPKLKAESKEGIADLRQRYPWAWDHLTDPHEPGNPLCEARVVAAYWQGVWDELHGKPAQLRVLATVPSEGAAHPWPAKVTPQSTLAVVLSRGLDAAKLADDAVTVRDAKGNKLPAKQHLFYGQNSNVVRLLPASDWPVGHKLTLRVAKGIVAFDGTVGAAEESFAFTVGAGPQREPGLPPKGSPWQLAAPPPQAQTPTTAADSGTGGCATGGRPAGAPAVRWTLLVAWMVLTRRRWSGGTSHAQ